MPDSGGNPKLDDDMVVRLRAALATCTRRTLTPEARAAIAEISEGARESGWTIEQLLVAVKDTCYTSAELTSITTTSERDAFLGKIVTACIQEFYRRD